MAVVGGAVLAARTLGPPNRAEPAAAVATERATPRPTVAATAQVARATPAPTHVEANAVPTPHTAATHAPVAAATHAPTATAVATHAPAATAVATHAATSAVTATQAPTVNAAHAATVTAVPATSAPTPTAIASAPQSASAGAVMLTFDAGADRGYAEDILDDLADQHVVASFGITGNWAKANPDLVRRMAADGHLVFNHTLDHRSFTGLSDQLGGLSAAQRRAELDSADVIIAPLIGHSTRPFYRLPYGDDDAHVAADVGSDGYTRKIGWTVDSEGWRGLQSTDILARCLKLAAPGALYVMHVGRESQDAIALPQLIHALREKGFSFQRVDS
jgi:peptidoglycan/xylan/chitin deacetylase (PgdA/CDA1 family)